LREVFETPYDEIAAAVGKSPATARQIARRAREHVAARRPRMRVDPEEQEAVVTQFLNALSTGNVQDLMRVMAPDVVAIADGGGVTPAARRPIVGAEKLAALLPLLAQTPGFAATAIWLNGMPGIRVDFTGGTTAISVVVENSLITHIYAITNPQKLSRLGMMTDLQR
jgi:RNA polymerase sigma-70 factor (ECF subfamily)